ncbi:flagellar export chaperone FliS [Arthrobacter crusticola]
MMMNTSTDQRRKYLRESVLSATPARLLTMLYDRLLLDLARAEQAQAAENWQAASAQLLHAQEIIAELSSSLKKDAWDGAENLFGLYTYVSNALMAANMHRDIKATRECIALLEPLREAWHEASASLPAQNSWDPARSAGSLGVA